MASNVLKIISGEQRGFERLLFYSLSNFFFGLQASAVSCGLVGRWYAFGGHSPPKLEHLETFRLPDPGVPTALACDQSDLDTVRALAREIHQKASGAFAVSTPDFLADAHAMTIVEWRKHLLRNPSALVYWGRGEKQYLDSNVACYLKAAKFGRTWYVAGVHPETKRSWQPDPETDKIHDEDYSFDFSKLAPFLRRVLENAQK